MKFFNNISLSAIVLTVLFLCSLFYLMNDEINDLKTVIAQKNNSIDSLQYQLHELHDIALLDSIVISKWRSFLNTSSVDTIRFNCVAKRFTGSSGIVYVYYDDFMSLIPATNDTFIFGGYEDHDNKFYDKH